MAKRDGTVDLRIKRTQKSIKNAFYELIVEKGFDHISVKDITERAMISRNTFYCTITTSLICSTRFATSLCLSFLSV